MEQGISLCITYAFKDDKDDKPKKSLYRIADYEHECFYEVDTTKLSDSTDKFYPKYLRCLPQEELPYYQPVVYEWKAKPTKNGLAGKSTTESFPNNHIKVFEIIIDAELIAKDIEQKSLALRRGISFPEGVADNILIAIEQECEFYHAVYCNKSDFKCINGKYYIKNNIEDILHTKHSLDVYCFNEDDIINTSNFWYFRDEKNKRVETRYFYKFPVLPPEPDRKLALYSCEEYLPLYLKKYLKKYAEESGLTKTNIKKTVTIVREALSNELEMKEFFSDFGYNLSDFEERLPYYEDEIVEFLNGSGFLDNIITRILVENDEIKGKLYSCAKKEWLEQADQEREQAELLLKEYEKKNSVVLKKKEELESMCLQLEEQYKQLSEQYSNTEVAMNTTINEFEKHIGEYLADSVVYKMFNQSKVSRIAEEQDTGIMLMYPDCDKGIEKKTVSDVSKACKVLEFNLKIIGMSSQYSMILSNIFIASNTVYKSLIVSGEYARVIADAFAYSIDGSAATRITLTNTTVNYKEVHNAVKNAPGKVILVENVLDTCNELTYVSLNKDFQNKLLVFNIENETTFSILSKSLWNYGLLINTDTSILHSNVNQAFKAFITEKTLVLRDVETDISNYQDIMNTLEKFELPIIARRNFVKTMAYLIENKIIGTEEYIDSVIAKYCEFYKKTIEIEVLEEIQSTLNENIKEIYGF